MGVRVIAIQLVGGVGHEHIVAVRWVDELTGARGDSLVGDFADWLEADRRRAWVGSPLSRATIEATGHGPARELRASRRGVPCRDLLDLPRMRLFSDARPPAWVSGEGFAIA